jgi:hypothetical protein
LVFSLKSMLHSFLFFFPRDMKISFVQFSILEYLSNTSYFNYSTHISISMDIDLPPVFGFEGGAP